jgi:hypothetical protein
MEYGKTPRQFLSGMTHAEYVEIREHRRMKIRALSGDHGGGPMTVESKDARETVRSMFNVKKASK